MAQVRAVAASGAAHLGVTRGAALAAGTAALLATAGRALAQSGAPLRVIGPPNDGFKPVYYAQKAGIFRKYGVAVEIAQVNSGAAAAAALIGGSADIAYTNITTLISAHNKGVPMQIVAPGPVFNGDGRTTSAILVLNGGGISSGKDLNGKTIGSVSLGDTMAASVQAWVDQNGGDSHTIRLIEVPGSAAVEMLESGRTAAVAINEPAVSNAIATGKVRALANPNIAIAKRFLQALHAVMTPVADRNADAMRRFAQAMHESAAYTNAHLPETVELVSGYSGIAPDVVARSARFVDAEYADPALVQNVIDVLVKYGITSPSFPARDIISPYALVKR